MPTGTPEQFAAAVREASVLLRAGQVVALPTETVYGLAANALNAAAVAQIYVVKGRPSHNPIIVHVATEAMARECVADWPPMAETLAQTFWPGPLTLVLKRSGKIPDIVTAGGQTVGIRWPSHPLILAVIQECGFPLAAPSANPSNQISPTSAGHVSKDLRGKIPLVVDGGDSHVGIESTVVDLSVSPPRLLRPGMISEQALRDVIGPLASGMTAGLLKSPGMLHKHYSPKAKLVLWSWQDDAELRGKVAELGLPTEKACIIAHTQIPAARGWKQVIQIPAKAKGFAREIYARLHQSDTAGTQLIVVEKPPETPEWRAIADRLRRAAA